jgi:hypothetical protein
MKASSAAVADDIWLVPRLKLRAYGFRPWAVVLKHSAPIVPRTGSE